MSNNSWADAHIVKPFIKTNEVVGLHAERDAHLVDWEGIERRMNARWEEIKDELAALGQWWADQATPHTVANRRYYAATDAALQAERNYLEKLYQSVQAQYMVLREMPRP